MFCFIYVSVLKGRLSLVLYDSFVSFPTIIIFLIEYCSFKSALQEEERLVGNGAVGRAWVRVSQYW